MHIRPQSPGRAWFALVSLILGSGLLASACDREAPGGHGPLDPAPALGPADDPRDRPEPLPELPRATSPRYDEVALLGTHNAYWVDRGIAGDLFGSGVAERLLDQLAFDRVRSLELDIHRDTAPGELRVYHTRPGNSLCDSLRDCLGEVRAFAWATPRHDPITLMLELKELVASNFDADHRPEDLDRILREELGPALFTPADLLARCPGDETLAACVKRARWPALADLRGRVLVALLGNWDELGAQATADWATYAGGPIRERAAFPMASSWKLRAADLSPRLAALVTQADLDRALAQSVFLQIEELGDPWTTPFLAAGGVVRANGADGAAAQEQRLALGVQVLQTDTPWLRARDPGPASATLPLTPAIPTAPEPGRRLFLDAEPGEAVFAYREGEGPIALAALVSSGRSDAVGCLRVALAADGDDSISVCRGKFGPTPGPDAERLFIDVVRCSAGACATTRTLSLEPGSGGVGDLLGLVGDASGCVRARAARSASRRALAPEFIDLGEPWCPGAPPRLRGIFRPSAPTRSTVGFFGLQGEGAFTVQLHDAAGARLAPDRLRDASAP